MPVAARRVPERGGALLPSCMGQAIAKSARVGVAQLLRARRLDTLELRSSL
jgi:hypothetical protein